MAGEDVKEKLAYLKGSEEGSREVHLAFAKWHQMLAEMEGMPGEKWKAIAKGEPGEYPELAQASLLLRQAAGGFEFGARACASRLKAQEPVTMLHRGYMQQDMAMLSKIAAKMTEMASLLDKSQLPSLEYVHEIENLLREQHMAMDRKTAAIGALEVFSQ